MIKVYQIVKLLQAVRLRLQWIHWFESKSYSEHEILGRANDYLNFKMDTLVESIATDNRHLELTNYTEADLETIASALKKQSPEDIFRSFIQIYEMLAKHFTSDKSIQDIVGSTISEFKRNIYQLQVERKQIKKINAKKNAWRLTNRLQAKKASNGTSYATRKRTAKISANASVEKAIKEAVKGFKNPQGFTLTSNKDKSLYSLKYEGQDASALTATLLKKLAVTSKHGYEAYLEDEKSGTILIYIEKVI